jgi:hypothetical protein
MNDLLDVEQSSPFFRGDAEPEVSEETEVPEELDTEESEEEEPEVDEAQEDESEDDSEESDDTEDDAEQDEDDEDEEAEDEEVVDTVPHAALHKERERRKATQALLEEQKSEANIVADSLEGYKESLSALSAQIKELGLEDILKVDTPEEVSSEVLELRQQKAEQARTEQVTSAVAEMREEASMHLSEFSALDGEDTEQAELILGFAMASTMMGTPMEDAVVNAMSLLNKKLTNAKKSARRGTKAPRKAQASKTSQKRRGASSTKSAMAKARKTGDLTNFFDSYTNDIVG